MSVLALLTASFIAWPLNGWFAPKRAAEPATPRVQTGKQTSRYAVGRWRLNIQKDRFTGQVSCSLRTRGKYHVSYGDGVVRFHLRRTLDVSRAWYRIDGRPAEKWQEDYADLYALKTKIEVGDVVNPTGGVVQIPAAKLAGATMVYIRPAERSRMWRFYVDRLDEALAAARENGCQPDVVFNRAGR